METNVLQVSCASNTPHYYELESGIYDGIAACLELIADNSRLPSFRESLEDAAEHLRRTDPTRENPVFKNTLTRNGTKVSLDL
jgi:hypothetical protein